MYALPFLPSSSSHQPECSTTKTTIHLRTAIMDWNQVLEEHDGHYARRLEETQSLMQRYVLLISTQDSSSG
jgi:hypothetical protein